MAAVQSVPFSSVTQVQLKHLLVTTDFSEWSHNALKQAAAIARLHRADLVLLHVIPFEPLIQSALEPATWEQEDIVRQAKSEIERAEAGQVLAGIAHELLIEHGALNPILAKLIQEREISLVVAGTHGRSGLKKLLLGSVAEEIFRQATCPVMTVGPHESPSLLMRGKFHSVLFATDFSPASLHALSWAISFAQESQARLTLLHAQDQGSLTAAYLHDRLLAIAHKRLQNLIPAHAGLAFPPEIEVVSAFPVEAILDVAEKKQADLIVLGAHQPGVLGAQTSSHLPWTIAHSVVCHAKCPVLTVRE